MQIAKNKDDGKFDTLESLNYCTGTVYDIEIETNDGLFYHFPCSEQTYTFSSVEDYDIKAVVQDNVVGATLAKREINPINLGHRLSSFFNFSSQKYFLDRKDLLLMAKIGIVDSSYCQYIDFDSSDCYCAKFGDRKFNILLDRKDNITPNFLQEFNYDIDEAVIVWEKLFSNRIIDENGIPLVDKNFNFRNIVKELGEVKIKSDSTIFLRMLKDYCEDESYKNVERKEIFVFPVHTDFYDILENLTVPTDSKYFKFLRKYLTSKGIFLYK